MGLGQIDVRNVPGLLTSIEQHRSAMLAIETPLDDGTMDGKGLFDDGVTVAEACSVSKKKINAEHLFSYTLLAQARCCVEIGTNVGISSAYIGVAMAAGGPGWELHTIESSPYRVRFAKRLHASLGLDGIHYHSGLFYDVLPDLLDSLGDRVDLAFIDGQHQYQPTLDFFNAIYEHTTPTALLIFDDIEWSDGMKDAWKVIKVDKRIAISTSFAGVGFTVTTR